ncbi:hypothetical protein GCM10027343_11890 [Noviherbaspirillum agri]
MAGPNDMGRNKDASPKWHSPCHAKKTAYRVTCEAAARYSKVRPAMRKRVQPDTQTPAHIPQADTCGIRFSKCAVPVACDLGAREQALLLPAFGHFVADDTTYRRATNRAERAAISEHVAYNATDDRTGADTHLLFRGAATCGKNDCQGARHGC